MIFGRQRAEVAQTLARVEERLADTLAFQQRAQRSLLDALGALRTDLANRDAILGDTFERIATTCARVFTGIETDHGERRRMAGALDRLTASVQASVQPAALAAAVPADAVAVRPDGVVEVRCRFGDRWVDGFEVCEMIADDERLQYRLRRRSDGSILPTLFAADDVRPPSVDGRR
jgi:hypothetical protein